jgi:hypothetical protein
VILSLQRRFGGWVVGGGYLLVLLFGYLFSGHGTLWLLLAVVAVMAFLAWVFTVRRWNAVGGTPTSRVDSAAQGYVELHGTAEITGGRELADPVLDEPCAWFRVETWRLQRKGRRKRWKRLKAAQSARPIGLRDVSGLCHLDIADAEFMAGAPLRIPVTDDVEHRLWRFLPGQPIYAIGEFETRHAEPPPAGVTAREVHARAGEILAEWKASPKTLLSRFDADRDGELQPGEWERARQVAAKLSAAELEDARRAKAQAEPAAALSHEMRAPRDGRLYLIADRDPDGVAEGYRKWAWVHLGMFLATTAGAVLLR